jgi:hypothetical protein
MTNLEVADETAERILGHSLGGLMATYNVSRHRKQKMGCSRRTGGRDSADRWRAAGRPERRASSAGFIVLGEVDGSCGRRVDWHIHGPSWRPTKGVLERALTKGVDWAGSASRLARVFCHCPLRGREVSRPRRLPGLLVRAAAGCPNRLCCA